MNEWMYAKIESLGCSGHGEQSQSGRIENDNYPRRDLTDELIKTKHDPAAKKRRGRIPPITNRTRRDRPDQQIANNPAA
jgi:hypothetical protein